MGANERQAALRRARQRQAKIVAATARAVKAHLSLSRAAEARTSAMRRHDELVEAAEIRSAIEAALVVEVCGSVDAAAEILGWGARELRQAVKSATERQEDSGASDAPG